LFRPQRAVEWFNANSDGWIDLATGKQGPPRKTIDVALQTAWPGKFDE
jgi:hypothetical protein